MPHTILLYSLHSYSLSTRALREDMGNIFKRMQDLNLKQEAENKVLFLLILVDICKYYLNYILTKKHRLTNVMFAIYYDYGRITSLLTQRLMTCQQNLLAFDNLQDLGKPRTIFITK